MYKIDYTYAGLPLQYSFGRPLARDIPLNGETLLPRTWDAIRILDETRNINDVHQQVTCAAPLLSYPSEQKVTEELWLDANILSQAKSDKVNPNIAAMLDWGATKNLRLSPTTAMIEYFRTNELSTAIDMIFERIPKFEKLYGVEFNMAEVAMLCELIPQFLAKSDSYLQDISDYMVLIRYFFHKKNTPFEKKCIQFAQLINNGLPYFRGMFLIGCLYFFIKENSSLWSKKVFGKIQSDMAKKETELLRRKSADNAASDAVYFSLSLFTPILHDQSLRFAHVATSDVGLSFLLSELCYKGLILKNNNVGLGVPIFRPGSIAASRITALVDKTIKENIFSFEADAQKLKTLRETARLVLNEKFFP